MRKVYLKADFYADGVGWFRKSGSRADLRDVPDHVILPKTAIVFGAAREPEVLVPYVNPAHELDVERAALQAVEQAAKAAEPDEQAGEKSESEEPSNDRKAELEALLASRETKPSGNARSGKKG